MTVIKQKYMVSYDPSLGAITITFFPISSLMLPFLVPIDVFRSDRPSELILKLHYIFMICLYALLALTISVPLMPLPFDNLVYFFSMSSSLYGG